MGCWRVGWVAGRRETTGLFGVYRVGCEAWGKPWAEGRSLSGGGLDLGCRVAGGCGVRAVVRGRSGWRSGGEWRVGSRRIIQERRVV